MGHGQVKVDALIQDEMTEQRSTDILSYWMGFEMKCSAWINGLHLTKETNFT